MDIDISGITIGEEGTLSPKGKINNLFSIGPHNIHGISNLDHALKSSLEFLKVYYPDVKLKTDVSNSYTKLYLFIIIAILLSFFLKYVNVKLSK